MKTLALTIDTARIQESNTTTSERQEAKLSLKLSVRLSTLWCGLMHASTTWPIHGHYHCRTCGRTYFVPWDAAHVVQPAVESGA